MSVLTEAWDRFFFSRAEELPPALFRISLGLLMLATFLLLSPNWERYYAAGGIASLDLSAAARQVQDRWCLFYWTDPWVPIGFWWWVALLAAAGFAAGWRTRACAVALYVLQTSMIHRNRMVVNGEDLVYRMLLFYSCFAPLENALSVDRLRGRGGAQASVWPIRLMQINVALIYLVSVLYKVVGDAAWRNGDALYWTLINETWSRWPWKDSLSAALPSLLLKGCSYGSLLLELGFPFLVLSRKTRVPALAAMAAFHVAIAVVLQNVAFFSLAMVCALWLFAPESSIKRLASPRTIDLESSGWTILP